MGKYNIILADPPWSFRVWSNKGKGRSAESHYRTMTKEDIQNLDVQSLAADDCVLFLWVTWPTLEEGLELIRHWGFEYKTCGFLWAKRNKKNLLSWFWGMGYWTRANTEPCLIATRGNPKRINAGVHQLIESPITRHSEKPTITQERIVKLLGDLPRIELFARKALSGWDTLGNEIDGTDIREVLKKAA